MKPRLEPPALVSALILMAVKDPVAANTLQEAAQADGIAVLEVSSVNEALQLPPIGSTFADHSRVGTRRPDDCRAVHERYAKKSANDVPILVVADQEEIFAQTKLWLRDG